MTKKNPDGQMRCPSGLFLLWAVVYYSCTLVFTMLKEEIFPSGETVLIILKLFSFVVPSVSVTS